MTLDGNNSYVPGSPVINPTIPFNGQILPLQCQQMIIIQGYISPKCNEFFISLAAALNNNNNSKEIDDIALCINVKLTEPPTIIRNSFIGNNWGSEEKEGVAGAALSLKRGHTFECIILVQEDHFKMAFNQQHYAEFQHRIQKELISNLKIDGAINIQTICFQGPGIPNRPNNGLSSAISPINDINNSSPPTLSPLQSSYTILQHASHPIINPPVPFVMPLVSMMEDQTICIRGKLKQDGNQIRFKLLTGVGISSDCGLQTTINLHEGMVERCAIQHGQKVKIENTGRQILLKGGQPFEHMLLVKEQCFRIAFNGSHYADFQHQLPLRQISHMSVDGDLFVQSVFFQGPGIAATMQRPTLPISNLAFPVPYKCPIPGGEFNGRMIYICGIPDSRAKQFVVNLRCGESGTSDVAFHFNPRFAEQTVVRNTHTNGAWGKMERQQIQFPFSPGQAFDMIILCEYEQFKVAVNNQHFIEYRHRLPNLKEINCLEVAGDVKLTRVQL